MKTNLFKTTCIACLSLTFFAGIFSACDSDDSDTDTTVDSTELTSVIDSCETLLDAATTDDYPEASITTFETTLSTAITAAASTSITQTAVDNLVVQLRAAKTTFLAAAYGAISSDDLMFGLSFDEGTGTQLTTTGNYSWTAVLTEGPSEIFGTATNLPSFITGKVGDAMYFSNGSHLEISDYVASALRATQMSISVWLKPDSTRDGNYIMSYNYWESWKLQLQSANKPYFTVQTSAGYVDVDNESDYSVPNNEWTHLVISLDIPNGLLDMYVNGELTKEWTSTTQPNLTGTVNTYDTVLPFLIGACTTYDEAETWDWTWTQTPAGWNSFIGSMDELKVYSVALTAGQVAKLYSDENE
jgi:hypothetical protein